MTRPEVLEARIACTELVERDADTCYVECIERFSRRNDIADKGMLADLNLKACRCKQVRNVPPPATVFSIPAKKAAAARIV